MEKAKQFAQTILKILKLFGIREIMGTNYLENLETTWKPEIPLLWFIERETSVVYDHFLTFDKSQLALLSFSTVVLSDKF